MENEKIKESLIRLSELKDCKRIGKSKKVEIAKLEKEILDFMGEAGEMRIDEFYITQGVDLNKTRRIRVVKNWEYESSLEYYAKLNKLKF